MILFYFILFCQKVAKRSHSFLKEEYFVTDSSFCKFFKSPNCDRKFEFFFDKGVVVRFMFDLPKFCQDKKICGK